MSNPKGVGLIGLSAKGSWAAISHLSYLKSSPNYKITALQNRTKEAATAASEKHSVPDVTAHDNPESLANDPKVDIVAVSVNVPQHYSLVKPALAAKKDVFVEWPLAANLDQAEELTKLAKEAGVRTMVGLQARYMPTFIRAKELVAAGKVGRVLNTKMSGNGSIFGGQVPEGLTYALPIEAGANVITIPFGHAIDALCFVLGELKSLNATLANLRPEMDLVDGEGKVLKKIAKTAHDEVHITGTLVNGGGVVSASYSGGPSRTGRDFYWEINGTEGTLLFESEEGAGAGGLVEMYQPTLKFVSAAQGAKPEKIELEKAGDWEKGDFSWPVGKAWDEWEKGGKAVITFEDALVRHRMIDAIYRSGEKGTRETYI